MLLESKIKLFLIKLGAILNPKKRGIFCLFIVFLTVKSWGQRFSENNTEPQPLYEVGAVGIHGSVPYYPGSSGNRSVNLILPYGVYRGEYIKATEDGDLSAYFFNSPRLKFDFSFRVGLPSNSEDNVERAQMPDLDWLGEMGPQMKVYLIKGKRVSLDFHLPIRHVVSTNFKHTEEQGFMLSPFFALRMKGLFIKNASWYLEWSTAWATKKLMQYFYEIEPKYAHSDRSSYKAQEGLLSESLVLGWTYRYDKKVNFFFGSRMYFFNNATNKESDLHVSSFNQSYVFGISWLLMASDKLQKVRVF